MDLSYVSYILIRIHNSNDAAPGSACLLFEIPSRPRQERDQRVTRPRKSGLMSGFEAKTSLSSTIRLGVGHSLLSNYFYKVSQNIGFLSNPKQNGAIDVASSRLHTICLLLSSPVVLLKEIQYEEANSGL